MECLIRHSMNAYAPAISQIIIYTLRESNAQDYSPEIIDQVELSFSPQAILRLFTQRQVFVAMQRGPQRLAQ